MQNETKFNHTSNHFSKKIELFEKEYQSTNACSPEQNFPAVIKVMAAAKKLSEKTPPKF